MDISERERSALKFAVQFIRGYESTVPDVAGIREGEATSDVLAALLARIDRNPGDNG
jgi:hypothetical protein